MIKLLKDLERQVISIPPEKPCPRQGELNNIRTAISLMLEEYEELNIEARRLVREMRPRIKNLFEDPSECGRHNQ